MGNRTAKFISALVGSIVAGAPLAAVSQSAPSPTSTVSTANAAGDCLASPKGVAPQGQHWFYRLERSTKRQCWYLRAEGGKGAQSAQATADTSGAESAASPSVQNARAEYITPQAGPGAGAPNAPVLAAAQTQPAPSPDGNAQQPAVAARWPDASASPAPQPAAAPVAAAAPSAKPVKAAAPVVPAAAEIPADKPTGSLPTLLLVIVGALALAGLLASIVYRFAGGHVRIETGDHRRVNWDHRERHDQDDSYAPWRDATVAPEPRTQQPGPVDFDEIRPQTNRLEAKLPEATKRPEATRLESTRPEAASIAAFSSEIGRIAAQSRVPQEEIAELDEADIFTGEFEIEPAKPRLVADAVHDQEPAGHDEEPAARDEDNVDIDVITAMLERLAQEGPRLQGPSLQGPGLAPPSLEADLADLARSQRGQSAARA